VGASTASIWRKAGGPIITVPDITGDANPDLSIAVPLLNLTSTSTAQGFTKKWRGDDGAERSEYLHRHHAAERGQTSQLTGVAAGTPAATFGTTAGTTATLTLNYRDTASAT
jgi:hypothetical protein